MEKSTLIRWLIIAFVFFQAYPLAATTKKVLLKPEIAFRAGSSANAKRIGTLKFGDQVQVLNANGPEFDFLDVKGNWVEIEYKGKRGWVFGYFLGEISDTKYYTINGKKVIMGMNTSDGNELAGVTKIGKLMFTTCALGQTAKSGTCEGTPTEFGADAINKSDNACTKLSLANRTWRVPTYAEAVKIKGTAIAKNAPKVSGGFFWTSTEISMGGEDLWKIIDYTTWQSQANFARDGYVICVSN